VSGSATWSANPGPRSRRKRRGDSPSLKVRSDGRLPAVLGNLWDSLDYSTPLQARAILDAATEVFAEQGFHAATTRQISERAELSSAGIYAHFRSKQSILLAICTAAHTVTDRLMGDLLRDPVSVDELASAIGRVVPPRTE